MPSGSQRYSHRRSVTRTSLLSVGRGRLTVGRFNAVTETAEIWIRSMVATCVMVVYLH